MLNQKTLLKLGPLLFAVIYFTVTFFGEETLKENDQLRFYRQLGETEIPVNSIRKLRILTLGGSVTWGAAIENRKDAYPFRLQNEHGHLVTNLAIRGSSSEYPAQCITSMLKKEQSKESNSYDPNNPFDVIIFEFSVNGMRGLPLLVQRLRERFPDALFIYVEMFSLGLKGNFESKDTRKMIKDNGGLVYRFGNEADPAADFDFRKEVNLYNPSEKIRQLFADDKHHASSFGHKVVATKIMELIEHQDYTSDPHLGSWLGGDDCTSWYENGETSLIIDGGEMKEWEKINHKFAFEINQQEGMIIEYHHDGKDAATIGLQYMTKMTGPSENDMSTSVYPSVLVSITQTKDDSLKKRYQAKNNQTGLIREDVLKPKKKLGEWMFLNGANKRPGLRLFHVTDSNNIGTIKPGLNYIFLFPIEERQNPFRLTAFIVCEACSQLGYKDDLFGVDFF